MQKKVFILFSMMLLTLFIAPASAQWYINTATIPDLETQTTYSTGYNNVIIDNHLEVGEGPAGTTSCPATTYGSTAADYPFVVNDISASGSLAVPGLGTAIVLWDNTATDPIRKIIGLSKAGGVAVYAGNDNFSGAGIVLNASGNPAFMASGTHQGLVQTISNVSTALGVGGIAFQHLNWHGAPGTTGTLDDLFSFDEAGNTNITGNLSFRLLGGDVAMRNIEGTSSLYGLSIYAGTYAAPGTGIQMFAPANTTAPGLMLFGAPGPTSTGLAYEFFTGTTGAAFPALQINNNGNTRIGSYGAPSPNDRLTVDGNLYLNATDNSDPSPRNIFARSEYGFINLSSGSNIDGSDGACQTAIAWNNSSYSPPGIGFPTPGAFLVRSYSPTIADLNNRFLAYGFQAYQASTSSLSNIFLINSSGQGIFGYDMQLSYINYYDVFTVQKALGFWSVNDYDARTIDGNTSSGALILSAQTGYSDGPDIELYGQENSNNGQIWFTSNSAAVPTVGVTTLSTVFTDYGSAGRINNFSIGSNGHGIFGNNTNLGNIVNGDVFTIKDDLGFYDPSDANYRAIHGNTSEGELVLAAKTTSDDGAWLELCGTAHSAYVGQVRVGSYGHDGAGTLIMNWDPTTSTFYTGLEVMNNGKVVIPGPDRSISDANVATANNYGLYVGDGILTEMVRVALHTTGDWADYVFADDYQLMPLNKVADYVKANNHLPDVPSAEEVKKEGIDMATMDSKLLQKIEELTLYVIQQEKRIDELQQKLDEKTK